MFWGCADEIGKEQTVTAARAPLLHLRIFQLLAALIEFPNANICDSQRQSTIVCT